MSQNGVIRAQPSAGASSRSRKSAGVTTVSSLESRLQDLGLSHVVGSGPAPAPVPTRGPQSRPGSSAGRQPLPVSKVVSDPIDEDCTYYAEDVQNDIYTQESRRGVGVGGGGGGFGRGQHREGMGDGAAVRPPSSQGRASRGEGSRPRSPLKVETRENRDHHSRQENEHEGTGRGPHALRAVDSPDSMSDDRNDSPASLQQQQQHAVTAQYGAVHYPSQQVRQAPPMAVPPRLQMHHYQFCPNCGFQLVENPIISPIVRPGVGAVPALPPGTVLASALPADSSDSDSNDDDADDPRRAKAVATAPPMANPGRRTAIVGAAGGMPGKPVSQAELAAGKGKAPAQSAAILKEMEGRRAQRLKQPGGDVVGQGKGIRGGLLLPKGASPAQDPDNGAATAGKHRRIGSVDHNIYSSAMPTKRGPLTMMSEAQATAEAEADPDSGDSSTPSPSAASAAAAAAAKKRGGVPPLPGKSAAGTPNRTSHLAPKRPEISRLQIAVSDNDSDDSAADAKVIDIPDGPAASEDQKGSAQETTPIAAPAGKGGLGGAGGGKSSKEGGFHASMPSPGHRRISSWADGGNLKHTDFILRKPYRDVMDVYDVHDEELGVGQFGVIRSCVNRASGLLLACKTISKERIVCIEDADDVRKEVQVMQQLRGHPNIIDLHETFEDSKHVHLVMELCKGGELFDRIKLRGQYSEHNAAAVFQTLVEALLYCHSNGIVHRDIKPENILLMKKDDDNGIKVIDFGVAARFRHGEVLTEFVGTPYYMAPEVLSGSYGPEADIWSAGIVLYIMLCGFPPFWGNSNDAIFDAIQNNELQFKSSKWRNVSEPAKDLIRATLAKDPKKRISSLDILGHSWVVSHTTGKS